VTRGRHLFENRLAGGTAVAALSVLLLAGCEKRPVAPPLVQGEKVFFEQQEGFHLEPPAGWSMHSRGSYPPGWIDQERTLVKYKRLGSPAPAKFRVTMKDLPDSTSVLAYLKDRPPGPEQWKLTSAEEAVNINGQVATRATYTGVWEEDDAEDQVIKEVVAFQRGNRVYFFTGIFPQAERKTNEVVRKAVASVVWDKKLAE
jgi:hypothetical protein